MAFAPVSFFSDPLDIGVLAKKLYSLILVSFAGFFRVEKNTKIYKFVIDSYLSLVFPKMPNKANAFKSASICFNHIFRVRVLARRSLSDIFNQVVHFAAISMVNFIGAPSVMVHKYHPVKLVERAFYSYSIVAAALIKTASPIANLNIVGVLGFFNVNKRPRFVGATV